MMLIFLWLCLMSVFRATRQINHVTINRQLEGVSLKSAVDIVSMSSDIIQDTNERIHSLYEIQQDYRKTAGFEVGYLVHTVQEKYRKMIDKYNTTDFMNSRLYVMEMVLYLEEIELHYWEIKHLVNMAHEIERKYKRKGGIHDDYWYDKTTTRTTAFNPYSIKGKRTKKFKWSRYFQNRQNGTTERYKGRFPWDYGWEVEGLP